MPEPHLPDAAIVTPTWAETRLFGPLAIAALQAIAAIYFVADGIDELILAAKAGITIDVALECFVALVLLAGVVLGIVYALHIRRELKAKEWALATARGALSEHIAFRFGEWGLTVSEADVALFVLKGCDVAEIARLRSAAHGTVRSQLSQIYTKAGVTSQATLISLFIEDLLERELS